MSSAHANNNQQAQPPTNLQALTASLRAAQEARGARTNRSGRKPTSTQPASPTVQSADSIVQSTDNDASGSRMSAVSLGYLSDPFATHFAKTPEVVRRMPIINRGTYVRTAALDRMVLRFLRDGSAAKQLISLGAGTDTRFFRFAREGLLRDGDVMWHELDFPDSITVKRGVVERRCELREMAGGLRLHGVDLRDLRYTTSSTPPQTFGLNADAETLILSEMCLSYLPSAEATEILNGLLQLFSGSPRIEILLYEPLQPNDAFGRTMISNLAARGISLPGVIDVPTLESHKHRLRDLGFTDDQQSWTVRQIWEDWIDADEKERLRSLEMVDEEEEWHLLAEHYGIIWARKERDAVP